MLAPSILEGSSAGPTSECPDRTYHVTEPGPLYTLESTNWICRS